MSGFLKFFGLTTLSSYKALQEQKRLMEVDAEHEAKRFELLAKQFDGLSKDYKALHDADEKVRKQFNIIYGMHKHYMESQNIGHKDGTPQRRRKQRIDMEAAMRKLDKLFLR